MPCSKIRVLGVPSRRVKYDTVREKSIQLTSLPSDNPEATASARPRALIRRVQGVRNESNT
jgi:hypothetical protein